MAKTYDFSGWATRNNLLCSDGRIIRENAFQHNNGDRVPLVWNHQHNSSSNILGHAELENRPEGVYAYCTFNNTEKGREAKELVEHGDITALSIYANKLKQVGNDVVHGVIREVSLVLAGANPEAFIDFVMEHSDGEDQEAVIYTGEPVDICHAEEEPKEEKKVAEKEKTVKEIFDELTEDQKTVVYALIGQVLEDAGVDGGNDEEDEDVKHNVFESDEMNPQEVLSHSEMAAIMGDIKRYGSLKDSFLAHGIENIGELFPQEGHLLDTPPQFIQRDVNWVSQFMNKVHRTPFSRIKSMFADITEDDARALGYLPDHTHRDEKGNLVDASGKPAYKKEEVFSLLKRTTTPTTIYKKQKFDRDDLVDITDFDFVAWIKKEMRTMLDEELARACLIGDGRLASSDDKINESNIRPIWTDADLFTIKTTLTLPASATEDDIAKAMIRTTIKCRKDYKGSGNPTLYTFEEVKTNALLLEDRNGRIIYDTEEKLRTAMRVSEIVSVPVMERCTRQTSDGKTMKLMGIIVNPADYNVGADRGGEVNMFDDFDIDYNQQKYLIETRCSGALIKPYSAVAIEMEVTE